MMWQRKRHARNKKSYFINKNDPLGSYTGTNALFGDPPEQDADDL